MCPKAKECSEQHGAEFLQKSFAVEQTLLKTALELSASSITHDGERGDVHEKHFVNLLRSYLPNRYCVDKAIVLDSLGHTSDQIDIVVYDKQYTPCLLSQQGHLYVPAEAVYAVFEVKPTIDKGYLEYAADKAASVRRLTRTSVAIPHAGGTFDPKPHFGIVAGLVAADVDWKGGFGRAFQKVYKTLLHDRSLDCGLAVSGHSFDTFDGGSKYSVGPTQNTLIYFLFRLLRKLQSLGTVPAIDWDAYADALSTPGLKGN